MNCQLTRDMLVANCSEGWRLDRVAVRPDEIHIRRMPATVHMNECGRPSSYQLESRPVGMSAGRGPQGGPYQLNGKFTGTFAVAGDKEWRFIRPANIGMHRCENHSLCISAWEISIEPVAHPSDVAFRPAHHHGRCVSPRGNNGTQIRLDPPRSLQPSFRPGGVVGDLGASVPIRR
jgi:hypothetical protein